MRSSNSGKFARVTEDPTSNVIVRSREIKANVGRRVFDSSMVTAIDSVDAPLASPSGTSLVVGRLPGGPVAAHE